MKVPNPPARDRARALRREATDAERVLWLRLRGRQLHGAKFRRQHPIGPFFADICCVERRLVVELDGGQHAAQTQRDAQRTAALGRHGYRVVRFWDHEVLRDIDGVLARIEAELSSTTDEAAASGEGTPVPRRG